MTNFKKYLNFEYCIKMKSKGFSDGKLVNHLN